MSGLIATGPAIRERLSCSALQYSHCGSAAERQDGLCAQARAGPVGPQSPQGLLTPLLGLASGLLQHHLSIHQPKLHLTVGMQPDLLADGLGNRDLPLASDPHAEPIWLPVPALSAPGCGRRVQPAALRSRLIGWLV